MNPPIKIVCHGSPIFLIEQNQEPYVMMETVTRALGLSIQSQFSRLRDEKFQATSIHCDSPHLHFGFNLMPNALCIPLRRFSGWLMAIEDKESDETQREELNHARETLDKSLFDGWLQHLRNRPTLDRALEELSFAEQNYERRLDLLKVARVWQRMYTTLSTDHWRSISLRHLSATLSIDRATARNAMAYLLSRKLIERQEEEGTPSKRSYYRRTRQ